MRVSVAYIAVPVTGLWNVAVLWKVGRETRLRLFGYQLAEYVATEALSDRRLEELSAKAKEGCIRVVANAVVLTQRAHPNMIVLLARLAERLEIDEDVRYDDWDGLLDVLARVPEHERFLLLDLLSVSAAFDGKLSKLEKKLLPEAFGQYADIYFERTRRLQRLLRRGNLNRARAECRLDYRPG
jgi:hypothetical protein